VSARAEGRRGDGTQRALPGFELEVPLPGLESGEDSDCCTAPQEASGRHAAPLLGVTTAQEFFERRAALPAGARRRKPSVLLFPPGVELPRLA